MWLKILPDKAIKYRWTSLYVRDRDSKYRLEYNEFEYKETKDDC